MADLNPHQFGDQMPLFPANNKKWTRPLEHAEMTPEQFKTLPGAWFHATYHDKMPTLANGRPDPFQAGVHFGSTKKMAEDRLVSLGPRNEGTRQRYKSAGAKDYERMPDDAPGDIHVRRLTSDAEFSNSPSKAVADKGGAWLSSPELEKSEYYKNKHEDKGALAIRVAQDSHVTSHAQAVEKALATGGRVHPLNKALLARGEGLDVPEKRTVTAQEHRKYLRNNPGAGY